MEKIIKFNIKVVSILIIIFIVIDLILLTFLTISKKITSNEFINESVSNYSFKEYLLDYETIKTSINNSKYPKEVFDYIDDFELNMIKKEIINNIINQQDLIINEEKINDLLINSVYEYENRNIIDIINYVKSDIKDFSKDLSINYNDNFVNSYKFLYNISNSVLYYLSIFILFILIVCLLFIKKGLLYSGIILFIYSFILYYFDKYLLDIINIKMFKYIKNINLKLDNTYIICFVLSFVLLLIYIVKLIKIFFRNQRIKDYINR